MLEVKVINENIDNFLAVLAGMGLAFDKTVEYFDKGNSIFFEKDGEYSQLYKMMLKRAKLMAFKGMGHNKFLRGIHLDLIVKAPCDWWQEQATYTTTDAVQSTSSMHMLKKHGLQNGVDPLIDDIILKRYEELLNNQNTDLVTLKRNMPAGYLYIRTIHLNYMTLQHMISQRKNHKLPEWKMFVDGIMNQVEHPYFLMREN